MACGHCILHFHFTLRIQKFQDINACNQIPVTLHEATTIASIFAWQALLHAPFIRHLPQGWHIFKKSKANITYRRRGGKGDRLRIGLPRPLRGEPLFKIIQLRILFKNPNKSYKNY